MPAGQPENHNIAGPVKLHLWIACTLLAILPVMASADPVVKCVQRELRGAGHNPRGVDGIVGPNTKAAAASWARGKAAGLPELDIGSAPRWCAALLTEQESIPDAAPGTERYCIWFQQVLPGVWLDASGVPVLRFRLASEDDGAGCYAWLNTVPDWLIAEPGTQFIRVERDGQIWSSGDAENGIFADTGTGAARYVQNGFTVFGVLTEPPASVQE